MINYAKHDEEFHAVFKLLSGDEVLGKTILTEDNGETLAFVQDPVCVEIFNKDMKDENKVMRGMAFNKWMQLAEEEFYIIREKDIIAVASMNKDVMIMYKAFITGSEISEERVENVSDYFVEGEEVKVKVLEVDRQGKIRLTMKGLED